MFCSLGVAEALFRGDQACKECNFQSLHVWLLLGRGDGTSEGPISRQPAALGSDSSFRRGSGSQWRPDRRDLQVRGRTEQTGREKEQNWFTKCKVNAVFSLI